MSLRLTLICNATTHAVRSNIFPRDEPLNQVGENQVYAAAVGFRPPRIAYTSPALRAKQTAHLLGLDATVEPALRGCDHGRWTGRSLEDVQAEEPDALATWIDDARSAPHGGESIVSVVQRIAEWLDARKERGRVVAVTHPEIVRAALVHVLEASVQTFWHIDVEPLARTEFSRDDRRWMLRMVNSTPSTGTLGIAP